MLFNSFPFLIYFTIFFPLYHLAKGRLRLLTCLVASYVFYAWWDWRFLVLIIFSTCFEYYVGLRLSRSSDEFVKKRLLVSSIVVNLGLLGLFKYLNFFIDSFSVLLNSTGLSVSPYTLNVILPLGISFYTFQNLSYTIDLFKKRIEVEQSFLKYALFIAFFPKLLAGPIIRAREFLPQLSFDKPYDWDDFNHGLHKAVWGLVKKVTIADNLVPYVNEVFGKPTSFNSLTLMIAAFFFSVQIYCDFSGYSDMAIGIARMMGFKLPENFKLPYFSSSFSEFWRRWHITLSTWFRDYIYILLGGNRAGKIMTFRNLMLTMLLCGLWHGANWTFVVWGGLHGAFLILQQIITQMIGPIIDRISVPKWLQNLVSIIIVFSFTSLAWVFFRSTSIETALVYLSKMLDFQSFSFRSVPYKLIVAKGVIMILFLFSVELISLNSAIRLKMSTIPLLRLISLSLMICLISFLGGFGQPFIYMNF
jgi:alginate O-acetyltransferase complex protein AlgI